MTRTRSGSSGPIAKIAAIASFILAGVMLVLTLLGFWHLRRVPENEEFEIGSHEHEELATASV